MVREMRYCMMYKDIKVHHALMHIALYLISLCAPPKISRKRNSVNDVKGKEQKQNERTESIIFSVFFF